METHITVKMDKKLKDVFSDLCEMEGVDLSHGIRELIAEAVARGYIVKERRERMEKVKA
ncbi:unknown [Betafusellovirus yellowstonense]|uniref:Uncharacterized protein n=1 Tax=Betafusellovirus yellowstonense TaxID=693629 RepID=D1GF94_9VIRU|nr:hypothetical protein SSSV1_gp10 [Acidianus spindle-shaped virus 1]ACZ35795.1 unknown [Acidianus spindle-shaped virus 1]